MSHLHHHRLSLLLHFLFLSHHSTEAAALTTSSSPPLPLPPLLSLATSVAAAAPTLAVTPTTLNRSGDAVTIIWSGVEFPSELDWLGIYSSPDSSNDDFIGYKFLSQSSPDTWQSGSDFVSVLLTNSAPTTLSGSSAGPGPRTTRRNTTMPRTPFWVRPISGGVGSDRVRDRSRSTWRTLTARRR